MEQEIDKKFAEAMKHFNAKRYREALPIFKELAEQGHAESQNNFGTCFMNGLGVPENRDEAFKWIGKAANQGLLIAQINMAECASYSYKAAWYRMAAEQGHAESQYELGLSYYRGYYGVQPDGREAFKWLMKAAEQGHSQAQYLIIKAYEDKAEFSIADEYKSKFDAINKSLGINNEPASTSSDKKGCLGVLILFIIFAGVAAVTL